MDYICLDMTTVKLSVYSSDIRWFSIQWKHCSIRGRIPKITILKHWYPIKRSSLSWYIAAYKESSNAS
ncbi:hypothetical protein BDB01DRAFT_768616 [Pilobolus umbonatus]|nr:hypothetical protein BDB01DRAFT_768616 [Pilobolus umbonatus]